MSHRKDLPNDSVHRLVTIAGDSRIFRDSAGRFWAGVLAEGDLSFLPLYSSAFRDFLLDTFFRVHQFFPSSADLRHALRCLQSLAGPLGPPPALRVSDCSERRDLPRIAIDAHAPDLQGSAAVEIGPHGWSLNQHSRVPFYRTPISRPFPDLSRASSHSLEPLRMLLHLASPNDWIRILSWLLAALRPRGPYPILLLQGPSPSGKSLAARMLRTLIDPVTTRFLPLNASEPSLLRLALTHYVLPFDHVTAMPRRLSDLLCRLASGAAFSSRDPGNDPVTHLLQRPVILTVPDHAAWSPGPDLASRLLVANFSETLPPSASTSPK